MRLILIDPVYDDIPGHLHGAYGIRPVDFLEPITKAWKIMPASTVTKEQFTRNLLELFGSDCLLKNPLVENPPPDPCVFVNVPPEFIFWLKMSYGAIVVEARQEGMPAALPADVEILVDHILLRGYDIPMDNVKLLLAKLGEI